MPYARHLVQPAVANTALLSLYLAGWSSYAYFWSLEWSVPVAGSGAAALVASLLGALAAGALILRSRARLRRAAATLTVVILFIAGTNPLISASGNSRLRSLLLDVTEPFPVLSIIAVPIVVSLYCVRAPLNRFGRTGHKVCILLCLPTICLMFYDIVLFFVAMAGMYLDWWTPEVMIILALLLAAISVSFMATNQRSGGSGRLLGMMSLTATAILLFLAAASLAFNDSVGIGGALLQLLGSVSLPVLLVLTFILARPRSRSTYAVVTS